MDISAPPEPQPATPPFQFRLRTLLLLFVVLGSSLGAFGTLGVAVFVLLVGLAVCAYQLEALWAQVGLAGIAVVGNCLLRLLPLPDNWSNVAALAAWLISVGTLLTHAMRSRRPQSVPPSPPAC